MEVSFLVVPMACMHMASGGGGEQCGGDLDRCMAGKGSPRRMDMVVEWLDARAECGRCGVDILCFCFNRLNRIRYFLNLICLDARNV
jgi:hypothetical protein